MLVLEFPSEMHRKIYEQMIDELKEDATFLKHPDMLFDYTSIDYDGVLQKVLSDKNHTDATRVPALTFFLIDTDNNILLGAVNIRQHINHPNLSHRGGHIGYGIRPKYQGKGYATQMLKLALEKIRDMGIKEVLLTCSVENIASKKVIEKNGGIFESEQTASDGEKFYRYWINI